VAGAFGRNAGWPGRILEDAGEDRAALVFIMRRTLE
jgi:hypothetical protein